MNDITQGMKFTIDVKSGLVEMQQRAVLMKGDKNANRVTMALVDGDKPVSLEGATVTGTYVLAGIKMPLLGDVNENEATIILPDECYLASGRYELRMHVTLGSVKRTFLLITGYVESDGEGGILDVGGVIPNIDDIIAQYAEMKAVTERTLAAAQRAEALAINASGYAANTGMLGGQPPSYYAKQEDVNQLSQQIANIYSVELLWENGSPSSVYPPHSETFDLSGYSEIEVEFRHNYANNSSVFRKCQIGTTGFVEAMETYNSKLYIFTRQFKASGNTVEFMSGHMTLENAVSTDNGRLVPIRIYGIKGVGV